MHEPTYYYVHLKSLVQVLVNHFFYGETHGVLIKHNYIRIRVVEKMGQLQSLTIYPISYYLVGNVNPKELGTPLDKFPHPLVAKFLKGFMLFKKENELILRLDARHVTPIPDVLLEVLGQSITLTHLHISYTNTAVTFENVLYVVTHSQSLTHLNLSGNMLSADTAVALAKVLRRTTTVTHLDLSGNVKVGKRGMVALADAFRSNPILIDLNLAHMDLNVRAAEALAAFIRCTTTLQQLRLDYNSFGLNGNTVLVLAITHNTSLRVLNLDGLQLGSSKLKETDPAIVFFTGLQRHPSLTEVHLQRNGLELVHYQALEEMLNHNLTLAKIRVNENDSRHYVHGGGFVDVPWPNLQTQLTANHVRRQTYFWSRRRHAQFPLTCHHHCWLLLLAAQRYEPFLFLDLWTEEIFPHFSLADFIKN